MEPIFSLPYSEFCVAEQLARLLPAKKGYSLYVPISRQQPGVDLVLAWRRGREVRVACIQIKSSRTFSQKTTTARTKKSFRYGTRFNNFDCPPQADFFCLVALYPAADKAQRRELGTWWAPQILLFSQAEMSRFLGHVRTRGGTRDRWFGFGFDRADQAIQTRGDSERRFKDFSHHLLPRRLGMLRRFLSAK